MIHLKITPDSRIDNTQVEQLAQTLCIYQSPLDRWNGKGFNKHHFLSFETVVRKAGTSFIVTVQEAMETVAKKAIESAWPRVSIENVTDPFKNSPTLISTLSLHHHYMFAIRVDRRTNTHLSSILDTINLLEKDDEIYIQTLSLPANKDWYQSAAAAYEDFKRGNMPAKLQLNKQGIAKLGLKAAASVVLGTINIVQELATGEEPEKINLSEGERALILREGKLNTETLQKVRGDAYDTTIRIGVVCQDPKRAKAIMRMVTMSFRELDEDNQFISHEESKEHAFRRMKSRSTGFKFQADYLSIPEVSRLFILPSGPLQEKYHIDSIKSLEIEIPEEMTTDGICIGEHEHKGKIQKVYQPVNNHDELCLPHIVIGGMGQGKTKGFAANWMIETVKNGFGALAIDPAKGEIGNEIEAAFPAEKVMRIKIGQIPISLDWCEVQHSLKAKNRLANTVLSFFNSATDEAGAQTSRYLRAAVMAMSSGKLSEIISILDNQEYGEKAIRSLKEGSIHKATLTDYWFNMSDGKRAQVLAPILNRLDTILGDEYLSECMESDNSLDMVKLLSQRKAIVIDVPKADLGPECVDLIVNLLSTKIDLAMTLRTPENQFPFFVLFDEPHQFLRSTKTWKAAAVESRKWRVGYVWLFHSWEQIPRDLSEIIKAAGPHYHLYPSSKKTFRDLQEEIAPFTLDDALKLKSHHAINIIRSSGEVIKPFIAHMPKPPSEQ